jgi:hypothetical protein
MVGLRQKGLVVVFILWFGSAMAFSSPPGGRRLSLPKANREATERLKEAYAAYVQGQYQRAIHLALGVYERWGDVEARWYPQWVLRLGGKELPDPHDRGAVLGATIGGKFPFPLTMAVKSTFPSYLLARCYAALKDTKGFVQWAKRLRELGFEQDDITRTYLLPHPSGEKPSVMPPKEAWRPLPLKFREEDYFILVPLDQACKILGLSCTITTNPKMAGGKGIRIVKPDAPNIVYRLFLGRPLVERLENGKGQTKTFAYAPYEEDGIIWVPFYWLAKQAGIRWWEVRNGKIYVGPK